LDHRGENRTLLTASSRGDLRNALLLPLPQSLSDFSECLFFFKMPFRETGD